MNLLIGLGLVIFWASTVDAFETPCPDPEQYGKVKCDNSYECIPRAWECDGVCEDCPGNTDEKNCPYSIGIYCDANETFVPWNRVCDNYHDCKDGADEDPTKYGCGCRGYKCPTSDLCFPKSFRCDYILDCEPYGEDEIGCVCDGPHVFQCGSDGPCLYNAYKCDGSENCPNGEDEADCPCAYECPDGNCLTHISQVCNGWEDCADGEDERDCPCSLTQFPCECGNNTCVTWDKRCDCTRDCPDGSDERDCNYGPPPYPHQPPPPVAGSIDPFVEYYYPPDESYSPSNPEVEDLKKERESQRYNKKYRYY